MAVAKTMFHSVSSAHHFETLSNLNQLTLFSLCVCLSELKMAGAASLQRSDRDLTSQSELSQIAAGYKPPQSSSNNNGQ